MPTTITTKQGDMVDELALRAYGRRDGTTTALVLQANPALCNQPVRLPAGLVITLPEAPTTMTDRRVKLWD
jgi:phage tail protein X